MTKKDKNIYVVVLDDGWAVRRSKVNKRLFNTQKDAIDYARELAKKQGLEIKIQGKNGKWRDADSHGNDPSDIPG